jgi:isohexenylglutaconyl-CoA hydratase
MSTLPKTTAIELHREDWVLHLTFNRPERKNALNADMVGEITAVMDAVHDDRSLRAIVLRGAGGNFSAGGDIKGFTPGQEEAAEDPVVASNRNYGQMLDRINQAPQAVIAGIEGASLGGGMGFTCSSDVAIAVDGALFGLPEARLGLIASQVLPLVVERIGLTRARMLAATGARFQAKEAVELGLVHHLVADVDAMEAKISEVLAQVQGCAAEGVAGNKHIMRLGLTRPRGDVIEAAAQQFAGAMRSDAAKEGVDAFLSKRKPAWAVD